MQAPSYVDAATRAERLETLVNAATTEASPFTFTATIPASNSQSSTTASAPPLSDLELPENVDPSFLAALPEEMRAEVIAEQLRLQRIRRRAAQPDAGAGNLLFYLSFTLKFLCLSVN